MMRSRRGWVKSARKAFEGGGPCRILMSRLFNRVGVDMLVETLRQELNYNLMFSQRGVR
jgi:hypothetical protein